MTDEAAIILLQERIAFLEKHIGELDGVLREAFERIEALETESKRMTARLTELSEPAEQGDQPEKTDEDLTRDRPPHW